MKRIANTHTERIVSVISVSHVGKLFLHLRNRNKQNQNADSTLSNTI